jgi:O-antigen ligase
MDTRTVIQKSVHRLWLALFAASVAFLSFSQTYAQICLAAALPLFVIDNFVFQRFGLSRHEKKLYLIISLFLGLEIISALSNSTPLKSLWELREEWLFLLIPISLRAFRDNSFHKPFLVTLTISVLAISLYGTLQHYTGTTFLRPGQYLYQSDDGLYRAVGNFHNPLTFGNYLAIVSVFLLAWGTLAKVSVRSIIGAIAGVAGGIVVFFSYERGSALGLFTGWFALGEALRRKNKYLLIGLVALIVTSGTFLAPQFVERFKKTFATEMVDSGATNRDISLRRTTIWGTALRVIKSQPLLGVGAGNFQNAYQRHADPVVVLFFSHAHNDVLNIAATSGIPALIVYASIWLYMLRNLISRRRRKDFNSSSQLAIAATLVASITFLVVSMTEVAFTKEVVRSILMVFWGFGLWGIEDIDSGSTVSSSESSKVIISPDPSSA